MNDLKTLLSFFTFQNRYIINGAVATLTANADGSLTLTAEQKPDTIPVEATATVPTYFTEKDIEKVIVYEMKPAQKFFFWSGIAVTVLFALAFVWWIFRKFYGIKR